MNEVINQIPMPNFLFSELINRKAKDFYGYRLRNLAFDNYKINNQIQEELWTLNKSEHKIQFIGYLINKSIEDLTHHLLICRGAGCRVEHNVQDLLYFLYGKLEDEGLIIDVESFSSEEIKSTNKILNEINNKLDYIKTGEELLYDDLNSNIDILKEEIESLKGLYPLGKRKWKKLFSGIVIETIANKSMEGVLKILQPYFSELLPYIKEFFLIK